MRVRCRLQTGTDIITHLSSILETHSLLIKHINDITHLYIFRPKDFERFVDKNWNSIFLYIVFGVKLLKNNGFATSMTI